MSFAQSTGYSEKYAYDAVGNMTQKTLDGQRISMNYNKTNQLTWMQSGNQRIDYAYDVNGNMTSKSLGELTDTYAYDVLGNLSAYTGYDGYAQQYAYSALGIRTEKQEKGDPNRLTLEAILEGKTLENIEREAEAPDADIWVKTSYIQDVTQPYAQVLVEKNSAVGDTVYGYGLERISAMAGTLKTEYLYDVRGSVAQKVTNGTAESMRYTPFGQQMNEAVSGYGYNGEMYDAATGMLHLRARQYELAMNRFSQKDILRGEADTPQSLNRYAFVQNDPVTYIDPSGESIAALLAGTFSAAVALFGGSSLTGVAKSASNKLKTSSPGGLIGGLSGAITGLWDTLYGKRTTIPPDTQNGKKVTVIEVPTPGLGLKSFVLGNMVRSAFEWVASACSNWINNRPGPDPNAEAQPGPARPGPANTANPGGNTTVGSGSNAGANTGTGSPDPDPSPSPTPTPGPTQKPDASFKNDDLLKNHYTKHVTKQGEYGNISITEYLQIARDTIANAIRNPAILSGVRSNGDTLFYNKATNDFTILSAEGFIRTLFKPADGLNYYLQELAK